MEFCRVDRAAWPRNEYFEHYFSNTPCTYSMTVKLDVTKIEEKGLKYYPALLYALTTVVNRHEEFRTALDAEGQVGIFSEMLPCYTVFNKETETFSNLWTEYTPDYPTFCARYQEDLRLYGNKGGMMPKPNPPENTFPVSMLPWATFEGFNLNLQNGYRYLLPIFTLGRVFTENGRRLMPLAAQVHHGVCDGFHLCRFVREVQELPDTLGE